MEDLERINQIYEKFYSEEIYLPNLNHTIINGVVSSGSEIIAFGMVRLYPEGIIVIDKDASPRNKITALKILNQEAIKACIAKNYKELNAIIHDDSYGKLLAKHFEFNELKGKLMQVRLE